MAVLSNYLDMTHTVLLMLREADRQVDLENFVIAMI